MQQLPTAPLSAALKRVQAHWAPASAPHHVVLAQTRAGKTTLIKRLLLLRPHARVLVLDPKPAHDAAWDDAPDQKNTWGLPVTSIGPGFGARAEGGGPHGYWFRLVATGDKGADERAFAHALEVVRAEGHTVLVVDDAREICRGFRLAELAESVMLLGGSNATSVILATQELGYVPGRAQAAFTWIGATGSWDAAKAAAGMLGKRGAGWAEAMAAIAPHTWCFHDNRPGNPGPVMVS